MKDLNEEEDFSLPMTPMIDIVFQLLIFFLLATTITDEERDIQVHLPTGTQGAPKGAGAAARLVISVRRDGSATLGGNPIEWADLRKKLLDAGRAAEKPVIFLRGDQEAPYGKIAHVLQICQEAKLEKVHADFRFEQRPNQ